MSIIKTKKVLKNILRVILVLLTLYLGYAGLKTYIYNHVYTTEQKINYIRHYYINTGFPRTNEQLLKSKIFKNYNVEYYPAKPLDPDVMSISFRTKHFDVSCSCGGNVLINGGLYYYENNNIYDSDSDKKIKDKKDTQLLNKELKEFTDKFGKHMGFQIYNPWNN